MIKNPVVLSIDQGTTGTRALIYNQQGFLLSSAYQEFTQHFPKAGWVEHDAEEIWQSVLSVTRKAIQKAKIKPNRIASIGITNQRETVVMWDAKTSKTVCRAIVWQDRRTSESLSKLKKQGKEKSVRLKTGLVLDPYFSASKVQWMLTNVAKAKKALREKRLRFGTIDSWLIWKLTGGESHTTDSTNASRTLLFNIKQKKWDKDLLKLFKVPQSILPKVLEPGDHFGNTVKQGSLPEGIPIRGVLGDQQAALYGQSCYHSGDVKNTYGTGCFIMANMGKKWISPSNGLLTTLACNEKGTVTYALEGAIFIAGAAVQWLRDGLQLFKNAKETELMAKSVSDSHGVTLIPAFAGLGSPHWQADVRGVMTGLTRGATKEHVVRATLESIAQQTADVIDAIERPLKRKVRSLKVDGGATANRFLMQFQADIITANVEVLSLQESTAWGVAKLAGLKAGVWKNVKEIEKRQKYHSFKPKLRKAERLRLRTHWQSQIDWLLKSL